MRHTISYRVPYADVDRMGVVYYANYLVYFERGRTEFLRDNGVPYRELEDSGVALPVIEAHCEYLKPACYDDLLTITTRAAEAKGVRIKLLCEVLRDGELLARGHTWHACIGPGGRPVRVPEQLRRLAP